MENSHQGKQNLSIDKHFFQHPKFNKHSQFAIYSLSEMYRTKCYTLQFINICLHVFRRADFVYKMCAFDFFYIEPKKNTTSIGNTA